MTIQKFSRQFYKLKLLLFYTGVITVFSLHINVCSAQEFKFPGNTNKQDIPFFLIKNLIVIPLYINGTGPYNFLLDTGVAQTIITDTTFIKALNLKKYNMVKVQGYGFGEEVDALLTRELSMTVGKARIDNIPTAIFKRDIFDLSSYLGVTVHGIIGYYFFNSFIVRINYSSSKLTIYNPESKVKRKGTMIPMEILNAKPYIQAEITTDSLISTKVDLLIDNGSSHPMLLESYDKKPFPLPKVTIPANLGVGINGVVNGSLGRVNVLKIADFTFNDILSGFPDFNINRIPLEGQSRNGSIGADVLRHFTVTFDYTNQAMYLKKTVSFKEKFEHDMSGLEIYVLRDSRNHFFIGRIEAGSPAEEVGLKAGDQFLSIDFKDAGTYTLSEINELLKQRDGRKIIMEVVRKNTRIFVLLKLKRRI